jgi:hypothetical protein
MSWSPDRDALCGRVAVVAGATRGAGRGMAMALGEAGAMVICQGRREPARLLPGTRVGTPRSNGGYHHPRLASVRDDARQLRLHRSEPARCLRSSQDCDWSAGRPVDFGLSESPRYVGRGVAALAADPDGARWNERSVTSAQVAHGYGLTDVDGSRPDIWRYIDEVREVDVDADLSQYR